TSSTGPVKSSMERNRKIHHTGLVAIACVAGLLVVRLLMSDHGLELRMAANAGDLGRVKKLLCVDPNLIDLRETRWLERAARSWSNAPQGRLLVRQLFSKYQVNYFRGLLDSNSETLDSQGPVLTCGFGLGEVNGATALHQAVYARHPEVVEYLCQRGADPNITDRVGATPLMVAVWTEQDHIVEMLLSAGAKLAPDNNGVSPLDHANLRRSEKVVGLLKAAQQREGGGDESARLRSDAAEKVEKNEMRRARR